MGNSDTLFNRDFKHAAGKVTMKRGMYWIPTHLVTTNWLRDSGSFSKDWRSRDPWILGSNGFVSFDWAFLPRFLFDCGSSAKRSLIAALYSWGIFKRKKHIFKTDSQPIKAAMSEHSAPVVYFQCRMFGSRKQKVQSEDNQHPIQVLKVLTNLRDVLQSSCTQSRSSLDYRSYHPSPRHF